MICIVHLTGVATTNGNRENRRAEQRLQHKHGTRRYANNWGNYLLSTMLWIWLCMFKLLYLIRPRVINRLRQSPLIRCFLWNEYLIHDTGVATIFCLGGLVAPWWRCFAGLVYKSSRCVGESWWFYRLLQPICHKIITLDVSTRGMRVELVNCFYANGKFFRFMEYYNNWYSWGLCIFEYITEN